MTKRNFNDFCREFMDLIDSYLNNNAWDITNRWFESGRGEITIEYDYDEINWEEVDPDWEDSCDSDLCDLCNEWGGSWDWAGSTITWGFNL